MKYKGCEIVAKKGDLTQEGVEAIVNPSNSFGMMGGGVAGVIRAKGGDGIEKEAVKKAPIPVGKAVITTGGKLKAKHVIHASTMESPAQKIGSKNASMATRAALYCAKEHGLKSIAFPGMGTGVGGVDKKEAALLMVKEIKKFLDESNEMEQIFLIGYDEEMYKVFKEALNFALL